MGDILLRDNTGKGAELVRQYGILFTCWPVTRDLPVTSDMLSIEIKSLGRLRVCFALAVRDSFSWKSRSAPEEVEICRFAPVEFGAIAGRPCVPIAFGLAPCKR